MSKFKDPVFRKQLSAIFIKLAAKIEQDEHFAEWIFEGTDLAAEKKQKSKKLQKSEKQITEKQITGNQSRPKTVDKLPLPDIYTIYLKEGTDALQAQLNQCEPELLKEILLANGLDPAYKVRRWKIKSKVVAFIIETVTKQMSKGKAFLN